MAVFEHVDTAQMTSLRHAEHPLTNRRSTVAQNYCGSSAISTTLKSQEPTSRCPLITRSNSVHRHQTLSAHAPRLNEHLWTHSGFCYCAQHLSAPLLISLQEHRHDRLLHYTFDENQSFVELCVVFANPCTLRR